MAIQNPQDLFVWMLSDVRRREERGKIVAEELSKNAEDPDIKETLDTWAFLKDKTVSTLDQCFSLINKQPVQTTGRLHDVFIEDYRRELNEIQNPKAKALYIASKFSQMMHLQIGEYVGLTAMADLTGNYGVGALVETCLADYTAYSERIHRRIRHLVEAAGTMRKAA